MMMTIKNLSQALARLTLASMLVILLGCGVGTSNDQEVPRLFVTWSGIGPDKWASVWLIKRHINPQAQVQFVPVAAQPQAGVVFDIPGADYYRNGSSTTFQQLLEKFHSNSPSALSAMTTIVHDIEVTPWGNPQHAVSPSVEIAFRGLQQHYGREAVSEACYLALFDRVYSALSSNTPPEAIQDLKPDLLCAGSELAASETAIPAIPEMTIENLLKEMARGRKVMFLDARESPEFEEGHIPGARNVKLEEVNADLAAQVKDADIVVPYCIKDFRGYEVARRLARYGVSNTVIMQPFGVKGWSDLNLPLQGSQKLTVEAAQTALAECISQPEACLQNVR